LEHFGVWTFWDLGCLGALDVLKLGTFAVRTFWRWDVLGLRRFVAETFCSWDVLGLGRFIAGTLCIGAFLGCDILSWDVLLEHDIYSFFHLEKTYQLSDFIEGKLGPRE
jgi:hypothetical protein